MDREDKANIVRLHDCFIFKNHVCLVFELLGLNLFEVIKKNNYHGLSMNLIQVFMRQIFDTLIVTQNANLIHCDLKPENILLERR